jgi:hypothetical protein
VQTEADIGAATLTSASAYFERNSLATVDRTNEAGTDFFGGFGNPLGPAFPKSHLDAVAGVFGSHQFITSQEIRLASRDSSAALTWLVGAFYALAFRGIRSDTGQSTTALYLDETPIHAWHVDTAFGNPYPVVDKNAHAARVQELEP